MYAQEKMDQLISDMVVLENKPSITQTEFKTVMKLAIGVIGDLSRVITGRG